MPVRCAWAPCSKAIMAPAVNAKDRDGNRYHTACYHKMIVERTGNS